MKKTIGILSVLLVFTVQFIFAQKSAKPNILFIAVDDLKPELGCYGNKQIKTPNIDRLAKMGTVFMNNYCQQAVCGPTRASLMTGMRPDVTQVWDLKTQMRDVNPDIVTLPQYLITQGYTTVGIGKIYHPSSALKKIDPVSWSDTYLVAKEEDYADGMGLPANKQYQNPQTKALFKPKEKGQEKIKKEDDGDDEAPTTIKGPSTECIAVPDNAYEDGANAIMAKAKIILLEKNNKPFFMAVGFHKPHLPFVAPKKYWDLYVKEDMPLAAFQEHSKDGPLIAYHKSGELRNYTDIPEFATLPGKELRIGLKEDKQKELIQGYYAAVSYMDAQVGILLNTLDSLGQLNNTIIVLWGDHGWHLGDHDLWEKHTNFEQATRAPLIFAAPKMKAGVSNSLSEHVDIFPTICALAGVPVPTQLEGKSLVPIMKNNKAKVKEYAISQYPRKLGKDEMKRTGYENSAIMGYSLRTASYRYTLWMNNFTTKEKFDVNKVYASEMYDYTKDPLEKVNVVNDKNYDKIAKDLYGKILEFFKNHENN
ncbi:MAG: sulfatase [Chitinophagaceae bacterium]